MEKKEGEIENKSSKCDGVEGYKGKRRCRRHSGKEQSRNDKFKHCENDTQRLFKSITTALDPMAFNL